MIITVINIVKNLLLSLALTTTVSAFYGSAQAQVLKDTVIHSTGTHIITHEYTADPAAMVYKDKAYLYTGHAALLNTPDSQWTIIGWNELLAKFSEKRMTNR